MFAGNRRLAAELVMNYPGITSSDPETVLAELIEVFEEGHIDGAVIRHRGEEFTLHTLGQITAVLYTVLEVVNPHHPKLKD